MTESVSGGSVPAQGRCGWCGTDPFYVAYHDQEWGVPEYDPRALWEKLILDGFQAGLAWITILRKREGLRDAFDGFDPVKVAAYGEADIERLLGDARIIRSRAKINAGLEKEGVKVSVNDLVIKAAAVALKQVPEANASYSPEGIAMHHHADIAMAVAIDGGLITPIIRKAEQKGLAQIATEAKDLAERARTRKLKRNVIDERYGPIIEALNAGAHDIDFRAQITYENGQTGSLDRVLRLADVKGAA